MSFKSQTSKHKLLLSWCCFYFHLRFVCLARLAFSLGTHLPEDVAAVQQVSCPKNEAFVNGMLIPVKIKIKIKIKTT